MRKPTWVLLCILAILMPQISQAITTRAGKGAPLSATDYDGNVNQMRRQCEQVPLTNPNDADRYLVASWDQAVTAQNIRCIVDPADSGESVVIALYEADASGDFTSLAANGLDGTTTITCDNDGAADDGVLSNASIAASRWVGIDVGTVTGTVTQLTVTLCVDLD